MLICRNAEGVHAHPSKCWRGTCSSVEMLKWYMVRKRLGALGLEYRPKIGLIKCDWRKAT